MSKVLSALPWLLSESTEARLYGVASRITDTEAEGYPSHYPQYTRNEPPHAYVSTPMEFWTSGFFPGCLWLMYERSKCFGIPSGPVQPQIWLELAKKWTEPLRAMTGRKDTHDLGFLFLPTFGKLMLNVTDDFMARSIVIQAAENLASRFNPRVGCTRSWDRSGHLVNGVNKEDMDKHFLVIIDNMMNLDLLYTAHCLRLSAGEDSEFATIANAHAYTTIQNHFNPAGGTHHVINYDQTVSEGPSKIIKIWAAQGYADDSVWARGQAWAIHGYARCAEWTDILSRVERDGLHLAIDHLLGHGALLEASKDQPFTGNTDFLVQARKAADYFVSRLGKGQGAVPPWDFDAPDNEDGSLTFRDVSAGMIAASGLLTLHTLVYREPSSHRTSPYLRAALDLVHATVEFCSTPDARFTNSSPISVDLGDGGWDTILNQSTINYNVNAARRWADVGLVYADFYFLEVGNKLLEMERRGYIHAEDLTR